MSSKLGPNTIRLYTRDTDDGRDIYPTILNERIPRTQTSVWGRRAVTGPISADNEEYLSSWTQDDYSGGIGIRDANETTDLSRIEFGVIDGRHPKSMCLPPETVEITKPAWASGKAWPLGDIGENSYSAWATGGIAGWDNTNQTWFSTQNTWPASFVPVNEPVSFGGSTFIPGGAEGTCIVTETTPATGTVSRTQVAGVKAVVFGLHDDKLWALDTDNHLWMLTALAVVAGAGTLANWGTFTAAGTYTGTELKDTFGNVIQLNKGVVPTTLIQWFNSGGEEALWAITRGKGAFIFNPDEPRWVQSKIKPGTHPDWGIDAEVFRDGEDMFIAGGGLDVGRETLSAEVPLSGLSKDQGVPPEYQGTIVDLLSERSSLYALVQAGHSVAEGSPTSTWTLQDTFGNLGAGTGDFNTPSQVAVDPSGNVYIADTANNRLQKFDSSGTYVSSITGLSGHYGVAVDASGNVYISHNVVNQGTVAKYNASLVLQTTAVLPAAVPKPLARHLATDGTHLYVTDTANGQIHKRLCSTLAHVATYGSSGSGNGQFDAPTGIAQDGTHLYIADTGNNRIQKLLASTGAYVAKWGTLGTDTTNLNAPQSVAVDGSGRIWVADYGNSRLQRFSNTGTYQTTISQSTPKGIGIATGDVLYVSSAQNNVSIWDEDTVSTPAIASKTWMGAWSGTAWSVLWESDADIAPTWMKLSLTGDYALWWGDEDGLIYRQLLPDPFFNPASRVALGVYPFAEYGWMNSVRFDANMGGWDKIASHFFAMMDFASADCYVDIFYRTDADQWSSGLQDPPWRPWKRVDHIGRTLCRFDDSETDPVSGEQWREGEPFQWIQFRYEFHRGADTYQSPLWMWHSLHFLAVPQDSETFRFKVPIARSPSKPKGRAPDEIVHTIFGLQTSRKMVHLQTRNADPDHPEWRVFFRGRVTGVKSEAYGGADNNIAEVVVFDFVGLGESSNLYTTLGVDIP